MKRETTPERITDKIMELCNQVAPGSRPEYIPVEEQSWSLLNECFPNVERMVREHGGQQVNGWAVWQWANMVITTEAHAVWENAEGKLIDITPHNLEEKEILFLPDTRVIFAGYPIMGKRMPLTDSPLVAEMIELMNERDSYLCSTSERTCEIPKELLVRIMQIQMGFYVRVGRNDPCPCQSGLKYKKCCGRDE